MLLHLRDCQFPLTLKVSKFLKVEKVAVFGENSAFYKP